MGTVVEVLDTGGVMVLWDSFKEGVRYRIGKDNEGLLLLDNAQTGVEHAESCDGCGECPIRGIRWKCLNCSDYNMCTSCYMKGRHDLTHVFKRFQSNRSMGVDISARRATLKSEVFGVIKNVEVKLRTDENMKGKVVAIHDKKLQSFRGDVLVNWNSSGKKTKHSLARGGKSELICLVPAEGLPYYEDHLPCVHSGNARKGLRVLQRQTTDKALMGTVTGVISEKVSNNLTGTIYQGSIKTDQKNIKDRVEAVLIQWDDGNSEEYRLADSNILLFDNAPLGIDHNIVCSICSNPIVGILWKCTSCQNANLCISCYMRDRHDTTHIFERREEPNKSYLNKCMKSSRKELKKTKKTSMGIFGDALVAKVAGDGDSGNVVQLSNWSRDVFRSEVEVSWNKKGIPNSRHDITELRLSSLDSSKKFSLYDQHLPVLGNDSRGYLTATVNTDRKRSKKNNAHKIQVDIWYKTHREKRRSFKPSLHIILANEEENEYDKNLVEEAIEFTRKTKLSCHVLQYKILFVHDNDSNVGVFIHPKTRNAVIEDLIERGFHVLSRGETDKEEDETTYFIRMVEYFTAENVLPVILSIDNGGMSYDVLQRAVKDKIPIVRLQRQSLKTLVVTLNEVPSSTIITEHEYTSSLIITEHETNIMTPWNIKRSEVKTQTWIHDLDIDPNEISTLSDIHSDIREDLDIFLCCLLIGVSMTDTRGDILGTSTNIYQNALSVYLLKKGKWRIPKEHMKKFFDYKALEYIYEQDLEFEFENGLWHDLREDTYEAYTPPLWGTGYACGSLYDDLIWRTQVLKSLDEHETTDDMNNDNGSHMTRQTKDEKLFTTSQRQKDHKKTLMVSDLEMYGLLFYALLRCQYYDGAKQLIEHGFITINHILIGCVILRKAEEDWRSSPYDREKVRLLNKLFTERAIRIIRCIYDRDREDIEMGFNDEFGIDSGRLLLNNGYIDDAIKTQNKTFLDNSTVNDILRWMWYGVTELSAKRVFTFFILVAFHMVILPLLMISMDHWLFGILYKEYKLPFMKVCIQMLGLLSLLIAYAYMLLFDYSDGISKSDYFIITWMASFLVDETKQLVIAIFRKKFKHYITDFWNILDWIVLIAYVLGMVLKVGNSSTSQDTSKVLLVATFILLCIRILNIFCMSKTLGPKLVMIRKMFSDTLAFMIIMTVIMICYNVAFYALSYSNSEFSWSEIEEVMKNGYWMLFGELNLDTDMQDCSNNRTEYSSGSVVRCQSQLGLSVTPYLKAFYGLIAIVLLLNLLIAMYSNTFQEVHNETKFHWSQLQTGFLEEYSIKTIFPIHLQLLAMSFCVIHFLFWCCCSRKRPIKLMYNYYKYIDDNPASTTTYLDGQDDVVLVRDSPMFVRVFLYETRYDQKYIKTGIAENIGALNAKGEMDCSEEDRLTVMQKKIDRQNEELQMVIQKKIDRQNEELQKVMENVTKLNENIQRLQFLFSNPLFNNNRVIQENEMTETKFDDRDYMPTLEKKSIDATDMMETKFDDRDYMPTLEKKSLDATDSTDV